MLNQLKIKFFLCALVLFVFNAHALETTVFLDGKAAQVVFNDGDTFRVVSGPLKGTRARTVGFNALESYGPIHVWGSWTARDLFKVSIKATGVAQKGTWHCTSTEDKDRYGRGLYYCSDLALELIRQGLAHVMLMSETPKGTNLLRAQEQAIKGKLGIWAKGAPSYVLTSVHSDDEESGNSKAYDRFVSTVDGRSFVHNHRQTYEECEEVCSWPATIEPSDDLIRKGEDISSCMVYVPFQHRYGANRAECL